jgi:hypothetical protein
VNISIGNAPTHLINPYGSGMAGEVGLAMQSFHSTLKKEFSIFNSQLKQLPLRQILSL